MSQPAAKPPLSTSTEQVRVMLVDPHPLYREGLSRLLGQADFEVVADVSDSRRAGDLARRSRPDVVLVDLDSAGQSVVRQIVEAAPGARVIALTTAADDGKVLAALGAGASGCILKNASVNDLVAATRAAADGGAVISPRIASMLVRRLRHQLGEVAATPPLTPREREVLELLARGWDNASIANALFVSPRTVKHHISSILVKLRVDNRLQAAVRAVRGGLLD